MFKSADKRLEELGFKKNDQRGIEWERYNEKHHYTQILSFAYEQDGEHVFMSYYGETFGQGRVLLTYEELKACTRKMKELKKYWKL